MQTNEKKFVARWNSLNFVAVISGRAKGRTLKAYFGKTLLKVAKNFLRPEMPLSVFW